MSPVPRNEDHELPHRWADNGVEEGMSKDETEGPLHALSEVLKSLDIRITQTIIVCATALLIVACASMRSCMIESEIQHTERYKASQKARETFWRETQRSEQEGD